MDNRKPKYILFLLTIIVFSSRQAYAQRTGDDFKLKLKESLRTNPLDLKPELKFEPNKIDQQEKDVLKVSPTTKLPTKYDKLLSLPLPPEVKINMNVTNRKSGLLTDTIDYALKKMLPDAVPSSLQSKIHRPLGPSVSISVGDLDPVRAIQARKRAKRQKKIDRIKKIYGQEQE